MISLRIRHGKILPQLFPVRMMCLKCWRLLSKSWCSCAYHGQFSIGDCYGCNAGVALETQRKRKQLLKI